MNILVVYYSLTGNTRMIAEEIAASLNSELLELKPVKELDPESGMKYFWGGFQATMRKKPELEQFEIDPMDYDLLFLGSPVWAWRQSPPMLSFVKKYDLSGKKLALWMCAAGNGVKARERFTKVLKDCNVIADICFQEPLQNNPENAKKTATEWAINIVRKIQN
ncbi:MAG: flavodoxin [Promethearchaeota archaeon]|nr:MAG: flavodoxin [Candidatus Lokiarchaeota archaeon]